MITLIGGRHFTISWAVDDSSQFNAIANLVTNIFHGGGQNPDFLDTGRAK